MLEVGKLKLHPLIIIPNGDIFILQSKRNRGEKKCQLLKHVESLCKPLFPTNWKQSDREKAADESERTHTLSDTTHPHALNMSQAGQQEFGCHS